MREIRLFLDQNHPEVYHYLPEPSLELPKVPKQWLANVCASVIGEEFSQWVKTRVNARHEKVADKKDIMIKMDPQMAEIFKASTAVSSKSNVLSSITNPSFFHSQQGSERKFTLAEF